VVQDFYNLVDVYLDAVYFPNCLKDENTFLQEGWHYELNNPSEDITFKGILIYYVLGHCCTFYVIVYYLGFNFFFWVEFLNAPDYLAYSGLALFIAGVVFNEMKGVYSQPDNVLGRVSQQVSFHCTPLFDVSCCFLSSSWDLLLNHLLLGVLPSMFT
jgi:hypothetical protein